MLPILVLSLFTFKFTLAVPSDEACSLLADYTQSQLRNISPLLEYSANTLETTPEFRARDIIATRQSTSPQTTNYLNAVSDALSQIGVATGSSSDQFRTELTQACGEGRTNKRSEVVELEVRQSNAPLLRQVYGSLSNVARYSRYDYDDSLDDLLGGLLDAIGDLLEEILDAVDGLLDGLGLGGLLDDLLDGLL
ncbi:hypothetical protein BDV12DRAFT_198444 [Aspergillus spectabilis]